MGRGSTVLGILALLIGAGGLGFGILAWFGANTANNQLNFENTWYDARDSVFGISPAFTYIPIPDLVITFNLPVTSSMFMSFSCHAGIQSNAGYASIMFYFGIDGVRLNHPFTRVGNYQGGSTNDYYSVSLQYYYSSMTPGIHNITVIVLTESSGHFVQECQLVAQSFTS